jgi:hypothetical protein
MLGLRNRYAMATADVLPNRVTTHSVVIKTTIATTNQVACRRIPVTESPLITQLRITPSKINMLLRASVAYAKAWVLGVVATPLGFRW